MTKSIESVIISCKYCNATDIVKFGIYKGVQRYFCKSCRRKFKIDSNTYHMKIPSEIVNIALNMYYNGFLISDIRKFLVHNYNRQLSQSIIYKWIAKYRDLALKRFKYCYPHVGDTWTINEVNLELDARHKVWLYDIMDNKTKLLLSSEVSSLSDINQVGIIFKEAVNRAKKYPKELIIHINDSSQQNLIEYFNRSTPEVQHISVAYADVDVLIKRFDGFENGVEVARSFKYVGLFTLFILGWGIYYNFFKPQLALAGKTPAEASLIDYDIKNWSELTHI